MSRLLNLRSLLRLSLGCQNWNLWQPGNPMINEIMPHRTVKKKPKKSRSC